MHWSSFWIALPCANAVFAFGMGIQNSLSFVFTNDMTFLNYTYVYFGLAAIATFLAVLKIWEADKK